MAPWSNLSAPKNGPRRLGSASANEAREAQNLAVVRAQRHVDELDCMRIACVSPPREALDLERDRPVLWNRPLAVERADIPPDHHADDGVDIRVGDAAGADIMSVAQHRVAAAEAEDLLQPMSDEDDRQPLCLQRADDTGEVGDLCLA